MMAGEQTLSCFCPWVGKEGSHGERGYNDGLASLGELQAVGQDPGTVVRPQETRRLPDLPGFPGSGGYSGGRTYSRCPRCEMTQTPQSVVPSPQSFGHLWVQ
jgi:hypothetical protein